MKLVPKKSTNDRTSAGAAPALMRLGFRSLGSLAPSLAARWAEALFFAPPRRGLTGRERASLATARRLDVATSGRRIAAWSWGHGPSVILVHGWGGRGAQLSAFAPPLVARGYRVVTFDGPGHGASAGWRSSLVEIAAALRAVIDAAGPAHAVVGHSLGGSAALLAAHGGAAVGRMVLVGAPATPVEWTHTFARHFAVAPEVLERMQSLAERRLGFRWSDLELVPIAARQQSPALVIHDHDDREVRWSDGAALAGAWPGARLLTTRGLGHRRILRDPGVISETVSFVCGDGADETTPARGPAPRAGQALEQYLYERDSRWAVSF